MTVRAKAIIEPDKIDYMQLVVDMAQELANCAEDVRRYLGTYPGKKPKQLGGPLPGGFYSQKQRRYFFHAITEDKIHVPYGRTLDLKRSWSITPVQVGGDALSVEIYQDPSQAPYGPYVQDPKVRPVMHSDWPTSDSAKQELEGKIVARLKAVGAKYGAK